MGQILTSWAAHRRLGFALAVAVLAVGIVTLVPFSYERTVGYVVSFELPDLQAALEPERMRAALSALGMDDCVLTRDGGEAGKIRVAGLPSRYAVRQVTAMVSALAGVAIVPRVEPVVQKASGSLYAQVTRDLGVVSVAEEGKTDEEIKAEIEAKLAAQGITGAVVEVRSAVSEGRVQRKVKVKVGDGPDAEPEIDSEEILAGIDLADTTRTDAQIAALIEARFAERGIGGVRVSVTTGADGKRRLEVERQVER